MAPTLPRELAIEIAVYLDPTDQLFLRAFPSLACLFTARHFIPGIAFGNNILHENTCFYQHIGPAVPGIMSMSEEAKEELCRRDDERWDELERYAGLDVVIPKGLLPCKDAKPWVQNASGKTPLMHAVRENNHEMAKILLEKGQEWDRNQGHGSSGIN